MVGSDFASNNHLLARCTDWAAALTVKNKEFNRRQKEKSPECVIFHCTLHRRARASENPFFEDLSETPTTVVEVVNLLKARPSNTRLFAQLWDDEAHQTLPPLHTEVRWLSHGQARACFHGTAGKNNGVLARTNTTWVTHTFGLNKPTLQEKKEGGTLRASLHTDTWTHGHTEQVETRFANVEEHLSKESRVVNPYISTIEDMENLGGEMSSVTFKQILCQRTSSTSTQTSFGSSKDPLLPPDWCQLESNRLQRPCNDKNKSVQQIRCPPGLQTGIEPEVASLVRGLQAQGVCEFINEQ